MDEVGSAPGPTAKKRAGWDPESYPAPASGVNPRNPAQCLTLHHPRNRFPPACRVRAGRPGNPVAGPGPGRSTKGVRPMTQRRLRPAGSLRLLVAEDEPHIRRILITLLEASGFQLTVAHDGLRAQALLEGEEPFDLALLDLLMPGRTGLELLHTARNLPHRQELPVIILTAKGQDVDRRRAFELGAADFMTKPFSPKKLLGRVDELLADR